MAGSSVKKYRRGKKVYSTRKKRSASFRGLQNRVHRFKRTYNIFTLDHTTGAFNIPYALDQMANVTEFSTLFDQYAIEKAEVRFVPSITGAEAGVSTAPRLYICHDHDGAGPSTQAQFLERGIFPRTLAKVIKTSTTPRVSKEIYGTALTTAYTVGKAGTWLDMVNVSVVHYGSYFLIEGATAGFVCPVYVTLYFKCKGLR